jgi:hypothetical protein
MNNAENENPEKPFSGMMKFLTGSRMKANWFIFSGIICSLLWITLFVAGLLVDSSYYRAAISYNFADWRDWTWVIVSFTISNVLLLSFLSGLIGGISSKFINLEGFTIKPKEFKKKFLNQNENKNKNSGNIENVDQIENKNKNGENIGNVYLLIENPFISAFRGIFIFIAILSVQYLSSFNDLGSISKTTEQTQANAENSREKMYIKLAEQIKDTVAFNKVIAWMDKELVSRSINKDSLYVSQIVLLKDRVHFLSEYSIKNEKNYEKKMDLIIQKMKLEQEIRSLRRNLKVPSNVDFSVIGISSFSYFKFAIIVSFFAFIFGYDPSLFAGFLSRLPLPPRRNTSEAK